MKTYKEDIMEKEMILSRINLLNHDSSRIYLDAENLAEITDVEFGEFGKKVKQFHERMAVVGQSILHMIRGSERGALEFLQAKDEVLCNLHRIKSNLEGIQGILDPQSSLYN